MSPAAREGPAKRMRERVAVAGPRRAEQGITCHDKIDFSLTASTPGGELARRRYQKGTVLFSKNRQVWLGRYLDDVLPADGSIVRRRPQMLLGTKKDLPTKCLALRKLDEILFRINASALPADSHFNHRGVR
jgi:hypothetical protein